MDNILYLDDYINLYVKKLNVTLCIKPYKNTLKNGKIIDKEKYLKIFKKLKEKYKLNNGLINENITIITNTLFSKDDKNNIKEIMEELNYKKCKFINEIEFIKINKKNIFINYNENYFYINYIDELGKIKTKLYENDLINKSLLLKIIKLLNKTNIIICGKNYKEIVNILKKTKMDYYYYEDSNNLFIELLKNKVSKFV